MVAMSVVRGISERLARYSRAHAYSQPLPKVTAAVLVPLLRGADGKLNVWLTRRQSSLSSHSGEVALPGGMREEAESPVQTALRESEEEIGLPPSSVEVLGQLRPLRSLKGHLVLPLVGLIENLDFVPTVNPDEVESAFACPLETFVSTAGHTRKDVVYGGRNVSVHYFDKEARSYGHPSHETPVQTTYNIWGLTALFMIDAAEVIVGRDAAFEKRAPQSVDPWTESIQFSRRTF